jgi:hypothetical protein
MSTQDSCRKVILSHRVAAAGPRRDDKDSRYHPTAELPSICSACRFSVRPQISRTTIGTPSRSQLWKHALSQRWACAGHQRPRRTDAYGRTLWRRHQLSPGFFRKMMANILLIGEKVPLFIDNTSLNGLRHMSQGETSSKWLAVMFNVKIDRGSF